jgi:hypothetical protein
MTQPLTDAQRAEMMSLIAGADSVELKLTVPETDRYATLEALEVDPLEAQIRQIFFFDTPDLTLDAAGVVVRARRIQGGIADTTVKLRPVVPAEISEDLRRDPAFGVEVDAMPGGFVCSASMKGATTNKKVLRTARAGGPFGKLFTKRQRELYASHAPEGLGIDDLVVLGPIAVFKLKMKPVALGRKLTLELWNYPDGNRVLELSTKCEPAEALEVADTARAFLTDHGVDLWGEQTTKTRTALTYFSEKARSAS